MSTELTPAMRRSILIAALRDPTTWPPNFKWQFSICNSCAMGLLMTILKIDMPEPHGYGTDTFMHRTAELLGLDIYDTSEVFGQPAWCPKIISYAPHKHNRDEVSRAYDAVTPALVADRLEAVNQRIAFRNGEG